MKNILSHLVKFIPLFSYSYLHKPYFSHDSYSTGQIETSIQKLYLSPFEFSLAQFKLFELDTDELGKEVAAHLDIELGKLISKKFNDGQCSLQVLDSVRGHNVYLIKSFGQRKINDGIIELLIAVNTFKKIGAGQITCIIPFFPYCQSKDSHPQDEKTFFTCFGSDILKLLQDSGCDRVVTFNSLMQCPQGYVNKCSFVNINAPDLFVSHLATKNLKNPTIVSAYINTPNTISLQILKDAFKSINLNCSLSTFNDGQYVGDAIKGNDVILYSNIMRTGNTFSQQSKKLKELGARNIYGCAFHCLSSNKQIQKLQNESYLKELLTTNSIPHKNNPNIMNVTSLSRIIAETISLFEEEKPLNQYRISLQKRKVQALNMIKNTNRQSQAQFSDRFV